MSGTARVTLMIIIGCCAIITGVILLYTIGVPK